MACSQLQLDEPTGGGDKTESTDEVLSLSDAITVEEAQKRPLGEEVTVGGYYVGYVKDSVVNDNTLILLKPGPKEKDPNVNLLLSDDEFAYEAAQCISIALPEGSKIRNKLNLVSHPETFKMYLLIRGTLDTYLGIRGISSPQQWEALGYYDDVKDELYPGQNDDDRPNQGSKDEGGEDTPDVGPVTPKGEFPVINRQGVPASRAY